MKKICTADVIETLKKICYENTNDYRSDFDVDTTIINEEMDKPEKERSVLLWLSYPSGTRCLREKEVFLKDSAAYITWLYYHMFREGTVVAYAITLSERCADGKIKGFLHKLNYDAHCKRLEKSAVAADRRMIYYEDGKREISAYQVIPTEPDPCYGNFLKSERVPNNPEELDMILGREKMVRDNA